MNPEWKKIGQITVVQAALGVSARDSASVQALAAGKSVIYRPTDGAQEAEIRFITPAEADAWVVQMYMARGDYDHYVRRATLTLTGGTQVHSTGKVFVDTLAASNEALFRTGNWGAAEIQSGTDYIARYHWPLIGYTSFLFIASTIETGKILEVEIAEIVKTL